MPAATPEEAWTDMWHQPQLNDAVRDRLLPVRMQLLRLWHLSASGRMGEIDFMQSRAAPLILCYDSLQGHLEHGRILPYAAPNEAPAGLTAANSGTTSSAGTAVIAAGTA